MPMHPVIYHFTAAAYVCETNPTQTPSSASPSTATPPPSPPPSFASLVAAGIAGRDISSRLYRRLCKSRSL